MPADPDFSHLRSQLDACMTRDRSHLARRLDGLRRAETAGRDVESALAQISLDLDRCRQKRAERAAALPKPTYPDELPVVQRRADIIKAISENQVVVLTGETGSGKTTQLPKICLELGRGVSGMIGHTQPRRIAARAVAMRIAQELDAPLGHAVGYKVRFNDQTRPETFIKVMTDGILLAEIQSDRLLEQYDTIIIDEAHERSLNIDFLLGYLKNLLPRRPDLKLIITSATIDPQRFADHFGKCPVLEISGRTYPVEVLHRPLQSDDPDAEDLAQQDAVAQAVDELFARGPGDVLVFLAGERDIRETAETLRKHHPPGVEILPLYARLSAEQQMRVFQPHRGPRIVLATNVAETSLTVPNIRYVIDPGLARISRYAARTKVQRLPVERVSQASADQRKGRCGRVGPGVCMRLYSEEDFNERPRYTDPEILRTHLAGVILQMTAFRLGRVQDFPFIDPPDYRAVRDGYQALHEIGAIDANNELTPVGHALARLPIDPRLGRMVLAAIDEDCLDEVLVIASALSVQDPRERPLDKQAEADAAHLQFRGDNSDFLAYLRLWETFHAQSAALSNSKLRKWCKENFLSYTRLREWHEIHHQLKETIATLGLTDATRSGSASTARR